MENDADQDKINRYEEIESLADIAFDLWRKRLNHDMSLAERCLGKGKISKASTAGDYTVWIKKHRG